MRLDQRKETVFPTQIDGCGINPDFRVILKILRVLHDDEMFPLQRQIMALQWFFNKPAPANGAELLWKFIQGDEEPKDNQNNVTEKPRFDWEFDAPEIYASFVSDYRIDLYDMDFLHWRKFLILFQNLSADSPFKTKIRLRFMDLKGVKGKQLTETRKAKESVQIPEKLTWDEMEMLRRYGGEAIWQTVK